MTRNLSRGRSSGSSSQRVKGLDFRRSRDLLLRHNRREDRTGGTLVWAASRQEVRWLPGDCCSHLTSEFWKAPPHLPGRTKLEPCTWDSVSSYLPGARVSLSGLVAGDRSPPSCPLVTSSQVDGEIWP